jgi:hypothetical protein
MTDDLSMFEHVAAQADQEAEEEEQIEAFQVDIADIIARQVYLRSQMKEAGFDRLTIAHTVATMSPEWWWERDKKGRKA